MVKCSFSGEEIEPGTGLMYVRKDGKILYFKNTKCKKNALKLGKKFLETRWSSRYKKAETATKAKPSAKTKNTAPKSK